MPVWVKKSLNFLCKNAFNNSIGGQRWMNDPCVTLFLLQNLFSHFWKMSLTNFLQLFSILWLIFSILFGFKVIVLPPKFLDITFCWTDIFYFFLLLLAPKFIVTKNKSSLQTNCKTIEFDVLFVLWALRHKRDCECKLWYKIL